MAENWEKLACDCDSFSDRAALLGDDLARE
jgi:hypothetical protein